MSTKINLPNMAELIKTSSEFNPTIKLDEFSSNPDAFIILLNAFNSNSKLSIDALIDGLIALYHETNISALKRKHKTIDRFLTTYEKEVTKILIQKRTKLEDFDELKLLGQGAFGCVKLIRHKKNKKCYAMKTLNKNYMNKKGIQENNANFMEERQILINGNACPWVINMNCSFQDKSNLYMVMEFMAGGDLFKLLERYTLPNHFLKFYAMEIILGIESIHNMNYLHRDIKPDNILLDRTGHIKLGDFGTCIKLDKNKMVRFGRAVGTPDYVPPEFLEAEGRMCSYGTESDYWSFGVVLYELIYNDVPFYGETNTAVYSNIMNYETTLQFPRDQDADITPESEDFIRNLITCRQKRFGQKGSTTEIKNHKWFTDNNAWSWDNIQNEPVPIPPELKSETDTSYFDEVSEVNDNKANYDENFGNESREFNGSQLPFIGFSYNTIPGMNDLNLDDIINLTSEKLGGNEKQNRTGLEVKKLANGTMKKTAKDSGIEIDDTTVKLLKQKEEENRKIIQEKIDMENELKKEREQINTLRNTNRELDVKVKSYEIRQRTMAIQPNQISDINNMKHQHEIQLNEIKELKYNLKTINDKLQKIENEKFLISEKYSTLQTEHRNNNSKVINLENENKNIKIKNINLQRNLEDHEQSLIEKTEKCKIIENKLKVSEQNLHMHKSQFRVTSEKYQSLLNEKENSIKKINDEIKMTKLQLNNAEQQKSLREKEKERLMEEINELQKKQNTFNYNSRQASFDINAKLNDSIKALNLKSSQLELEKRKHEEILNKINSKEEEIKELKRMKERDETNRETLLKQISDKQKQISELTLDYEKIKDEHDNLKSEHNSILEIYSQLKQKLSQKEGQMKELADEFDASQKFHYINRNIIADLESQKSEWTTNKNILEEELKNLRIELNNLRDTIKENPEIIFNQSAMFLDMQNNLEELKIELQSRKEINHDLDNKYRSTLTDFEQIKAEKMILENEITNMKKNENLAQNSSTHTSSSHAHNSSILSEEKAGQFEQENIQLLATISKLEEQVKNETKMKNLAINKLTEMMAKKNSEDYTSNLTSKNKKTDKVPREVYRRKEKELSKSQNECKQLIKEYDLLDKKFQEFKSESENNMNQIKLELENERKFYNEKLKQMNLASNTSSLTTLASYPTQQHTTPHHNSTDNLYIIKGKHNDFNHAVHTSIDSDTKLTNLHKKESFHSKQASYDRGNIPTNNSSILDNSPHNLSNNSLLNNNSALAGAGAGAAASTNNTTLTNPNASILNQTITNNDTRPISGTLSIPKHRRGKGGIVNNLLLSRGVPTWKPQFAVADNKQLRFYEREGDTKANIIIEISNIMHVRGSVTTNDVHQRLPKSELPKILQLIYSPNNENSSSPEKPIIQLCMAKNSQEQNVWVDFLQKKVKQQILNKQSNSLNRDNPNAQSLVYQNSNNLNLNLNLYPNANANHSSNNSNSNNNLMPPKNSNINKSNSHVGHSSKFKNKNANLPINDHSSHIGSNYDRENANQPSLDQQFSAKSTSNVLGYGREYHETASDRTLQNQKFAISSSNLPNANHANNHAQNSSHSSQRAMSPRNNSNSFNHGNRISPVLHKENMSNMPSFPTYSTNRYSYNTVTSPNVMNTHHGHHSQGHAHQNHNHNHNIPHHQPHSHASHVHSAHTPQHQSQQQPQQQPHNTHPHHSSRATEGHNSHLNTHSSSQVSQHSSNLSNNSNNHNNPPIPQPRSNPNHLLRDVNFNDNVINLNGHAESTHRNNLNHQINHFNNYNDGKSPIR